MSYTAICTQCDIDIDTGKVKDGQFDTLEERADWMGDHTNDTGHTNFALGYIVDAPHHRPGYPGQPQAEAAWVHHASDAIVEALRGGATEVVFNVPTQMGSIVFDERAFLAEGANPWREKPDQEIVFALNGPWTQYIADGTDGMLASEAALRISRLVHWKVEAMEVLGRWERAWEAAGRPGPWGGSKADNVKAFIERQRAELRDLGASYATAVSELAEFKQWASDACELLHQVAAYSAHVHEIAAFEEPALDLLRRMENP